MHNQKIQQQTKFVSDRRIKVIQYKDVVLPAYRLEINTRARNFRVNFLDEVPQNLKIAIYAHLNTAFPNGFDSEEDFVIIAGTLNETLYQMIKFGILIPAKTHWNYNKYGNSPQFLCI